MNHTAYEEDFIPWVETHLRHDLADESAGVYPSAARKATRETGLAKGVMPAVLPFTVDELLDFDFEP